MPDAQIHPTGTVSTPADYVVPDAAELLLKGVYAKFNGTSAAGSYQPLVRIISDAGSTVIEAVSDTTVAAGASADVSWFPHLAAAAAASTGTTMVFADANTNFGTVPNVAAGGNRFVSFDVARSTDTAKISWLSVVNPNDTLRFNTPAKGSALLIASCIWPAGTKIDCRIDTFGQDLLNHDGFDSFSGYDKVGVISQGTATLMDVCPLTFNVSNGPIRLSVNLSNSDAAASAPDQVGLACIFFPDVTTA